MCKECVGMWRSVFGVCWHVEKCVWHVEGVWRSVVGYELACVSDVRDCVRDLM